MATRQVQVSGLDYLELVTGLLQAARLANPLGGVWEAADLQWWWRRDQHPDPARQTFWIDDGTPLAAVILTDWGNRWACDVISGTHDVAAVMPLAWPLVLELLDKVGDKPVEMLIRAADGTLIEAADAAGFRPMDEGDVTTWMRATERPTPNPLPDGFHLTARSEELTRPHPMITRNGAHVAERLGECSLYRPELDLAIYAPAGEVAAYGLFWADPVTGVGLVEPMRTEDRFQGQGLAGCLLAEGLDRLAAQGCAKFKVSYMVNNPVAKRLYRGAGFRGHTASRTYRR